jgi:hypothetical protein
MTHVSLKLGQGPTIMEIDRLKRGRAKRMNMKAT